MLETVSLDLSVVKFVSVVYVYWSIIQAMIGKPSAVYFFNGMTKEESVNQVICSIKWLFSSIPVKC